jgi:hypothetical protein
MRPNPHKLRACGGWKDGRPTLCVDPVDHGAHIVYSLQPSLAFTHECDTRYPSVLEHDTDAQSFLQACFRRPDDPPDDGQVQRRATCDELARRDFVVGYLNDNAAE